MNKELIEAANSGNLEEVRRLLSEKRKVKSRDIGYALQDSAKNGHTEVVRTLMEVGRVEPRWINYALSIAAENGHTDVVRTLMEVGRVEPSWINYALSIAAENGHVEALKLLMAGGSVTPDGINYALQESARNGQVESLEVLMADQRFDSSEIQYAFRNAARNGQVEALEILMADRRVTPDMIHTRLFDAARNGQVEALEILMANERVEPWGINSALESAAENGHVEALKLLMADERVEPRGINSALESAAKKGRVGAARVLMTDKRVTLDGLNIALQKQDEMKYSGFAKFLLSRGVQVVTDGREYSRLPRASRDNLLVCRAAQNAVDASVDSFVKSCPRAIDKKCVELASAADVFSSDKTITEISEPRSKGFIDAAVQRASEWELEMQRYDKGTKHFVARNSPLIDRSLAESNPKEWDVKALGAQKTLVNLAMWHGGEITGVEELQGAGAKRVKSFIDSIPEENGKLLSHSPSRQEVGVLSKQGLGLPEGLQAKIAGFLPAGSIKLSGSPSRAPVVPRSPQHAGKKVDDKKEQGLRGGKGGGMGR